MTRILFINSVCNGSTGTICKKLYKAAEDEGYDCCIAYGRGEAPKDINTIKIGNKLGVYLHVLKARLFDASGFGSKYATKQFIKKIDEFKPDIIHLHNIHGYYINIEILFEYLKEHPEIKKIWTLHDCWAFTGHCPHFLYENCKQWKNGCFKCVRKNSYPKSFIDNCKRNYLIKKDYFNNVNNLSIVCVSKWLETQVKESMLSSNKIHIIKNGIDTSLYKNISKECDFSNLKEKKIILGVANVWNDKKGLNDFIKLSLKVSNDFKIVLIGLTKKQLKSLPKNIIGIEKTNDISELVNWYNKAYVFFNPTKEETFGLTNYEAQVCGVPVFSYDSGGTKETIINKNAFLIKDLDEFIDALYNKKLKKEHLKHDQLTIFDQSHFINDYLKLYC